MQHLGTLALDAAIDIDRMARGAWVPDATSAFIPPLVAGLRALDVDGDPSDTDALRCLVTGLGREVATVDDLRSVILGYADDLAAFGPGGGDAKGLLGFCLAFHAMALAEWDRRWGDHGWFGLMPSGATRAGGAFA